MNFVDWTAKMLMCDVLIIGEHLYVQLVCEYRNAAEWSEMKERSNRKRSQQQRQQTPKQWARLTRQLKPCVLTIAFWIDHYLVQCACARAWYGRVEMCAECLCALKRVNAYDSSTSKLHISLLWTTSIYIFFLRRNVFDVHSLGNLGECLLRFNCTLECFSTIFEFYLLLRHHFQMLSSLNESQ